MTYKNFADMFFRRRAYLNETRRRRLNQLGLQAPALGSKKLQQYSSQQQDLDWVMPNPSSTESLLKVYTPNQAQSIRSPSVTALKKPVSQEVVGPNRVVLPANAPIELAVEHPAGNPNINYTTDTEPV